MEKQPVLLRRMLHAIRTPRMAKEKLHACETLADMAKQYDMKFIWTRIFSVYGKYDDPGTLIMSSIEKMKRNESIQVTACTQLWDYLYVEDAARAMVKFAEVDCENGIYNVASGNIRPLKEYVEEIRDVIGSESLIEYGRNRMALMGR
ncbi:MAG: NAD-dependent epimerase/dehydratase family protein [Clostridia bacterium]